METKNIGDSQGETSKQGTNKIIRRTLYSEADGSWVTDKRSVELLEAEQLQKEEISYACLI